MSWPISEYYSGICLKILATYTPHIHELQTDQDLCFYIASNYFKCCYFERGYYFGIEVLTAVAVKDTIFWAVTFFTVVEVNRRFGGT
jgi:hypothetical protein